MKIKFNYLGNIFNKKFAKLGLVLVLIIIVLVVSGCLQNQEISMENMPCHQMPDGSWMGQCDEEVDGMFKSSDLMSAVAKNQAKGSEVLELKNNELIKINAMPTQLNFDGIKVDGYGYNGQIPGPLIKVDKDDKIKVDFTNNLNEPTTVHWHGLRHDIKDDGVPGVSQDPVLPGESHLYNLYFPDEGLFWYHPHIREDRQQDLGLYGAIRVGSSDYDERYLILDDLLINNGQNLNHGQEANFALMGRYGNLIFVNGQESYSTEVKAGEITRFFIANVANARPFRISFPGAKIKAVGGDIGNYQQEIMVDEVIVAPAERVSVDVQYLEAGKYNIVHRSAESSYDIGSVGVVAPTENSVADFSIKQDETVKSEIISFRSYFDKQPDYTITLDLDMSHMNDMPCHKMGNTWMGNCEGVEEAEAAMHDLHNELSEGIEWEDTMQMMNWMSNSENIDWKFIDSEGNENMDIKMNAKVGDKVKIKIINTLDSEHPMQHPIHLHGQRFLTISIDGKEPEALGWEDTILIPAGSTAEILVDVTNPGEWMMHCHIAEHLEAGMMASFNVEA